MKYTDPFPSVSKLAEECGRNWRGYPSASQETARAEAKLRRLLLSKPILDSDACLVLFGSFARHEMDRGSDHDWAVVVDGVVKVSHAEQTRAVEKALEGIIKPGPSGIFGCAIFSHDLVHCIGGQADSNTNLTQRILLLLESRYVSG